MNSVIQCAAELATQVENLEFLPPVSCVYNPLNYAWEPHRRYLERYGKGRKQIILLGMNPGPFGMAQTGVPFGTVSLVKDWLGISGRVEQPQKTHPKRPIEGFACKREEVSGQRLWGWAKQRFGTPNQFFAQFFVWNYCPLAFMEASGKNRTPDKLRTDEQQALYATCDRALRNLVEILEPEWVLGVGGFAAKRAELALANPKIKIGQILHPSPASPLANKGWSERIETQLSELGIKLETKTKN